MDPQTKARLDFDIGAYKARADSGRQRDYSGLSDATRPFVFAHAAFALLDQAISEHVDYMRSQDVPVQYKRTETGLIISFGLRRAVYQLKLDRNAVGIAFFVASPYPGGVDEAVFVTPWPPDEAQIEHLDMLIRAIVEDMCAFLLNGKRPATSA